MISKLFSFKATLVAATVAFGVGLIVGAWAINKFYAIGEVSRLESYIEQQKESHRKAIENLQVLHGKQIKIAADNIKIEKVIEYVPDNRECDINDDTERLLDVSRTGLSVTSTGVDATIPRPAAITQRQQIRSCGKDGIQFRKLKALYDAQRQFYLDNWVKP